MNNNTAINMYCIDLSKKITNDLLPTIFLIFQQYIQQYIYIQTYMFAAQTYWPFIFIHEKPILSVQL